MTLLEAENLYYNTQVHFRKCHFDGMPNDSRVWAERYAKWLSEQGCVIVRSNDRVLRNSLGIAPGYDKFGFERSEDATMFALRWS